MSEKPDQSNLSGITPWTGLSERSEFNLKARSAALQCECRKDQACPIHAISHISGGMRRVIEESVYSRLAGHITRYTKTSVIRTMVESCPIDSESRNRVFRLLCALKSDMVADGLRAHNVWIAAGRPDDNRIHRESACGWCSAPKEALANLLGDKS